MNTSTLKTILVFGGIIVFLAIYFQVNRCDCEKRIDYANVDLNRGIDLDELYTIVDTHTLPTITRAWQALPLRADSSFVEAEMRYLGGRTLRIVSHYTDGQKHYGGIIFPKDYDQQKQYPLLVWAAGLNQAQPSIYLLNEPIKTLAAELDNHFILVPAYRGQALKITQQRFCSDGFFGDAYDGATDDALRLLDLVKNDLSSVDTKRISVIGVSRGGTVALLMAGRDTTLKSVVSIAGPTDFYTLAAYRRYGQQYKYQFLSTSTSIDQIRDKMIKSSPIYFVERYPNPLLLIHGKKDRIVNVTHAKEVINKLSSSDHFKAILHEGGHEFYDWGMVVDWVRKHG